MFLRFCRFMLPAARTAASAESAAPKTPEPAASSAKPASAKTTAGPSAPARPASHEEPQPRMTENNKKEKDQDNEKEQRAALIAGPPLSGGARQRRVQRHAGIVG